MTIALNLSTGYLVCNDPITVTYQSKTAEGTWAAGVTVNYAQRNAPTLEDYKNDPALLQKTTAIFHLWTVPLSTIVPKQGDKFTDPNSLVWVVRKVESMDRDATAVQRYRCTCLEQLT